MLYTDIIDSVCSCLTSAGAGCINEFDGQSADDCGDIFCTVGMKNVKLSDRSSCCDNGMAAGYYHCECTVRVTVTMAAGYENDGRALTEFTDTKIIPAVLSGGINPVGIEVSECSFNSRLGKIQCEVLIAVIGTVPCSSGVQ